MTIKAIKLRQIENAAAAIESGVHSFVCHALDHTGNSNLRMQFEELFCPDWALEDGQTWCFESVDRGKEEEPDDHQEYINVRLIALGLFYEIVSAGK